MPTSRLSLVFAIASLSMLTSAQALASEPAFDEQPLANMATRFERLIAEQQRGGIVWLVSHRGRLIASGALGMQDRQHRTPMSPQTTFRLYSMTRAITSVAALRLIDNGALKLADPVAKYLPEFARPAVLLNPLLASAGTVTAERVPTIRDLFTYTAGFGYARDYPADLAMEREAILGLDVPTGEGIRALAGFPLLHQPGERWHYGFASDVLGRVIEVVTGKPLNVALAELVLAPLQMTDTAFYSSQDRLARAYAPTPTGLADVTEKLPRSSRYVEPGVMHSGGGGLVGTAADYLKFCEMLRLEGRYPQGQLIRQETAREMTRNQISSAQGPLFWHEGTVSPVMQGGSWGLGIGIRLESINNETLRSPAGELFWGGLAGTGFFIHPGYEVSAVVMSQYLGAEGDELAVILREGVYQALSATETELNRGGLTK